MKMKRFAAALLLLFSLLFLFACGREEQGELTTPETTPETTPDAYPVLSEAPAFVNDGGVLSLTVPNATEEFSFYGQFRFTSAAYWDVQPGRIERVSEVEIPRVGELPPFFSLSEGANPFTLVVATPEGEDVTLYPIVIYRKPLYTVSFDGNGGSETAPIPVEEGAVPVRPADPTRTGYTFAGWDQDLSRPVTSDLTASARWTPNDNTPYTVETYLENAAGTGYEKSTERKTGTTDTALTLTPAARDHFTLDADKSVTSGTVSADGSLVLKLYYVRDVYTVSFVGNGGTVTGGNATQRVRYGNPAAIPSASRNGYSFAGWDHTADCDAVAGDLTVTAQWTPLTYSVSYDPDGGTLGGTDPVTYTIETDVALTPPTRPLYEFAGWYSQNGDRVDNLSGHYGNLTLTAFWTPGFTVSEEGEITGIASSLRAGATELEIPAEFDGKEIVSIGEGAFADCPLLSSVVIPEGITSVGDGAFANCPSLASVVWNAVSCPVAGSDSSPVFSDCPALQSIAFGEGVTAVPDSLCYGCTGLSSVIFGHGIEKVGDWAFFGCTSLASVSLQSGVETIGVRAFSGCTALALIAFPDSVSEIGSGAFENCTALASVTFGKNLAFIDGNAFRNCTALASAFFYGESEWFVTTVKDAASGVDLTLENTATAAGYLKNVYCTYYWYKK